MIIQSPGLIAEWLQGKPTWARLQRWVMASLLGALAARLALHERR